MKKSFIHLVWSQANISFKQSSQTDENVLKEDDKPGKQCQREHVNFSPGLEAKLAKSRLKIHNLAKQCLLLNEATSKRSRVNKTLEDLQKFGHLCNEMLFLE